MTSIPEIRTERLILRAPRQSDFAGFSGFYASDRSSFVGGPLTERRRDIASGTEMTDAVSINGDLSNLSQMRALE